MNKKQIIEAIKEERNERWEDIGLTCGYIVVIAIIISFFIFLFYGIYIMGQDSGRGQGWDEANKSIINNIDKYGSVKLTWSNGTDTEYEVEKVHNCYGNLQFIDTNNPIWTTTEIKNE